MRAIRCAPSALGLYGADQPWRCLWRGFFLQMMRITPLRRTTLQCSQIGFTLARTFIVASLSPWKTEA